MSYYEEFKDGRREKITDWDYLRKINGNEGYFHVLRLNFHTVIRKG